MPPRVYLDTCAIQRPLDDQSQQRIRLEADAVVEVIEMAVREELVLLGSEWLRAETENGSDDDRLEHARGVLALATVDVPRTAEVEDRAREMVALGVDAADALHLSFAVEGSADFLCTVDDRFLRQAKGALPSDRRETGEAPYITREWVNREAIRVVLPHELIYALHTNGRL